MQIEVTINDKVVTWDVANGEFLADTLRAQGLLSVKKACETSCCGLCTVWIDGKSMLSCSILSSRVHGKKVTTIEGVPKAAEEFAQVLSAEGAEQCGFCSPGFIMNVLAMKNELVNPSEEEIIHYLTGNLCRCTGYMGQLRAVKTYLGVE
ncbi:2Fe-2S iron-sulfur cluster-binding protein [Desulfosporosinus sp. Sb-LF]|uniref:(2Fe-2S)-binding protein n=1 Tax=Desulfosporosinus sp. Sb-LF TaxID=2560027 RepID=UPI00107F4DB5|nr:2Fe-2S iron-sulfur cluster-binding protein [Desulfosporosinus sp. Sb-LF]TGE33602.1 2Fe-2S iron-sulfur cluster binding domain-containing protein [Desulfosporosinus sp. Sb-LF]